MSFGKRTREEVEFTGVGRDVSEIIASRRSGPDPKLQLAIGGGVVAVAGLAAFLLLGSGDSAETGEAGATQAGHGQIASMCLAKSKAKLAKTDAPFAGLGGDGTEHMPDYLNCLMSEQPQRLCNATDRSKLARELATYFRLMKSKQREFDAFAVSEAAHKLAEQRRRIQSATGAAETDGDPRPEPDAGVVAAMQALAADGRLVERDFSPSSYAVVAPLINDLVKPQPGC